MNRNVAFFDKFGVETELGETLKGHYAVKHFDFGARAASTSDCLAADITTKRKRDKGTRGGHVTRIYDVEELEQKSCGSRNPDNPDNPVSSVRGGEHGLRKCFGEQDTDARQLRHPPDVGRDPDGADDHGEPGQTAKDRGRFQGQSSATEHSHDSRQVQRQGEKRSRKST